MHTVQFLLRAAGLVILSAVASMSAWVQASSGASWPDGTISMVMMLGADKTLSDAGTWNGNAQWAMEQWNRNMGRSQFTWSASASTAGGNGNLVNEMYFSSSVDGEAWGTNVLAVTLSWSAGTRRTQGDILFNDALGWDAYRGTLRYSGGRSIPEFRRVALHELGHVIGLSHPDQAGQSVASIMNASISSVETLQADDKDGAGALYGPGVDNQPTIPVITTHPSSRTVVEGDYTSFSVYASGTAPLSYQWKKDGSAISGATSASYSINSVAAIDAGDYTVVVTNAAGSVVSNVAKLTVTKPAAPTISSHPYNTWWNEGSSGSLQVYASGSALRYQWRLGGVNVPGANSATYSLSSVSFFDAGEYDVVVSNAGGSVTSNKCTVTVNAARPPLLTSIPGRSSFQVGEYFSLGVGTAGTSPLTSIWRRGGVTLASQTSNSIYFSTAQATDAGTYDFTLSNPLGSAASGPIVLEARPAKAPVLILKPTDIAIEKGQSMTVYANASGAPSPTYVWTKDGVTLPGWNYSNFSINSASAANAGTYTVEASNSAGTSATHSFKVAVVARKLPLAFMRVPASTGATAGGYPNMSCALNDSTGVTLRWYKDGVEIPNSNSTYLSLYSMTAAMAGKYAVEATVENTTIRSPEAELKLLSGTNVLQITSHPASLVLTEGASDYLSVSYNYPSGGSYPTLQWYKDGVAISGATGYSYSAYPWTAGNSGNYTVKITVGAESVTSEIATVEVRSRPLPHVIQGPASTVVPMGNSLSLGVNSRWGTTFKWKRDGVVVQNGNSDYFSISTVTASHAGNYTVEVANSTGSVETAVAKVEVLPGEAPTFTRHPGKVRTSSNYSTSLDVATMGSQPITYQWKKGGVTLPGFTSSSLYVSLPTSGIAGDYTVVASNAFGSVESDVGTIVYDGRYGQPIVTRQPADSSAVIGQTGRLTAVAWGDPAPTIQWRKAGVNIAGATKWKLEIPNAQLADSGSYDAVITNSYGSVTTQSANLTIGIDNGRIVALSARAQVGTGSDVLIPGFFVSGSTPKKLLIRALGPTLAGYGVQGALADPKLELKTLSGTTVATNDDWSGAGADTSLPGIFTQVGASALASGSKDAALVATLDPGLYTAVTSGVGGTKGVALLEVFDVDPAAGKLTGISTRAIVGTGSNVLIPGIVVDGPVAKKLLIRVSGPALAQYGVAGTLADPKLELKTLSGTTLQTNDNWDKTDTALVAATTQNGLPAFADGSKDAALLTTLSAGLYTIVISGADGGSGVALVEVYEVP